MREFYFHRGTRRLSLILSVPVALIVWIFLDFFYALLIGGALCLVLSLLIPLFLYIDDRIYRMIARVLPESVLSRHRIHLRFPDDGGEDGCLYVCAHALYLCGYRPRRLFVPRKPLFFIKIPHRCVRMVEMQEHLGHLCLLFWDKVGYDFLCVGEDDLLARLKSLGYNIGQKTEG